MLRKLIMLLRKRSKTAPNPEQAKESREQRAIRLVAMRETENFWSYDGTSQQPIDPIALLENSQ